jgi:hypothetical protein
MPSDEGALADRLVGLENHTTALDARLSGVEKTLTIHSAKLDRIVDAVSAASGRPHFDPVIVVGFVKDTAVLFGLICAGIIYVASNISSAGNAVIEHRVNTLEQQLKTNQTGVSK